MPVADPGGQIRPWPPHRNCQWSLAPPLRDRKSNGSIVILLKSKEFGKFWEIDGILGGKFFGKLLKKVGEKFMQKFGPPPVSEVRDPLVDDATEKSREG